MNLKIISELANSFLEREKIGISANDLIKSVKEDTLAWAWCMGMGSEANIYFVKKDSTILSYDHYKCHGYGNQIDAFYLLQEMLCEQGEDWEQYPCMYSNNLYISLPAKAWFELLCNDLNLLSWGNPYTCLERICRELEKNSNAV
jgi:hypothetical protein